MFNGLKKFLICSAWCTGILLAGADHADIMKQMLINVAGLSLFLVASIMIITNKE